ncbi:MAG: RNA polymerase sigma factor [Pseudomonadota bacterium]
MPEPTTPANHAILQWLRQSTLRQYAFRLLGNASDVEDVLQTVAEKFLGNQTNIEHPERYVRRAVRNAAIDLHRTEAVRAEHQLQQLSPVEPFHHAAETAFAVHQLQTALGELPAVSATMFRMHYLEGLSQKDIAAHFGVHLSSVEKRLAKAKAKCMKAMGNLTD